MSKIVKIDEATKFCPSDWIDEYAPCLVKQPEHLLGMVNGHWFLRESEEELEIEVKPGDVVAFHAYRSYGSCTLTIYEDGSHDGDWPDDTTHFQVDGADPEDFHSSIDDLIQHQAEWGEKMEPGSHDIECWYWSETGVNFRFDIVDGNGKFTRVEEPADVVH